MKRREVMIHLSCENFLDGDNGRVLWLTLPQTQCTVHLEDHDNRMRTPVLDRLPSLGSPCHAALGTDPGIGIVQTAALDSFGDGTAVVGVVGLEPRARIAGCGVWIR